MINKLTEEIIGFRDARDWKQFHDAKNLSEAITIEASELMEVFLWDTTEEAKTISTKKKDMAADEIADVYIFLLLICHELGLDLEEITRNKLKKNDKKYPVAKSKGSARKYTELDK